MAIITEEFFKELNAHKDEKSKPSAPATKFDFDHQMTVGDLIDYLLTLNPDDTVISSIFRPMEGLIYKQSIKFSQIKRGGKCVYINNYLTR